ncbi:MAG: DUF2927 domain-containing protein [Paracoccaceae bacterium]
MHWRLLSRLFGLAAMLVGLSACEPSGLGADPTASPGPRHAAPSEAAAVPASAATVAARAYYARVERNYLSQELLRTDGGGADTPFSAADLAENFLRIAFYEEYSERSGQLVAEAREIPLHRWTGPVRLNVEFGASVPLDQRARDRAEVAGYAARLSALTGLPMRMSTFRPNHTVLILNAEERAAAARRLAELLPDASEAALRSVTAMAPETYCTVFAVNPDGNAAYSKAVTVIRGELPDRLRQLCVHEELAQSLGLVNDSPRARPSIFNDNEEFALLTRQDELMLKMLYDPRLRPGMTLLEARPIVARMAAELMGGES